MLTAIPSLRDRMRSTIGARTVEHQPINRDRPIAGQFRAAFENEDDDGMLIDPVISAQDGMDNYESDIIGSRRYNRRARAMIANYREETGYVRAFPSEYKGVSL